MPADDARLLVVVRVMLVPVEQDFHDDAVVLVTVCVELVEADVLVLADDAEIVLLVALLVVVVCGV